MIHPPRHIAASGVDRLLAAGGRLCLGLLLCSMVWASPASASPSTPGPTPTPSPQDEASETGAPTDQELRRLKWYAYGIPYVSVNSTDGFMLGAGGEIFARDRSADYGYDIKLTPSTLITTNLEYNSHYLQVELRRWVHVLSRFGYQGWTDMPYAGAGGADIIETKGEAELGNGLKAPYLMVAASLTPPGRELRPYAQVYTRYARSSPLSGGLLAEDAPFGLSGGFYGDVTIGVEYDQIDRWPLPLTGHRGEVDVRLGGTWADGSSAPLAGLHGEWVAWASPWGDRLTFGTRLLASKTVGVRPWFEQGFTGGRWRDELGYEQALSGYGRLRTRGDGALAAAFEVRPLLYHLERPIFDLAFYLSAYVEEAFLFDGWDPGPHLPSVGIGPVMVWKGASIIRPFIAWGWTRDEPGAPREPNLQFTISVLSPL